MTSTRWYGILFTFLTVFVFSHIPAQAAISTTPGDRKSSEQELQALFEESLDFLLSASDKMEEKGGTVLVAIAPIETEMFDEDGESVVGLPDFLQKYLPSPKQVVEGAENPAYGNREHIGGPSSPNRGFAMLSKPANIFKMMPPLQSMVISSRFGWRHNRPHQGTDFAAPTGANILAVESGKVAYAGWGSGYGNMVTIDHGNNMKSRYAHCSKILVKTNQMVKKGQVIAKVGSTGRSTGPHLHFEVMVNGTHQNPEHHLFR